MGKGYKNPFDLVGLCKLDAKTNNVTKRPPPVGIARCFAKENQPEIVHRAGSHSASQHVCDWRAGTYNSAPKPTSRTQATNHLAQRKNRISARRVAEIRLVSGKV